MAKPQLKLYVDTVSPFAYLAFYVVQNSPIFKQCDVTYVPVFLGGIMKACGNTPPINVKNKSPWMDKERLRWARLFSVPMKESRPPEFPMMTLPVQRALCAVDARKLPDLLAALYQAAWVEHRLIHKPEETIKIFESVLGKVDGEAAIQKSTSNEVKQQLTLNTEQAMAEGAFGLPWFVATNSKGETEGMWGFDHIGQVLDHLGLERGQSGQEWRSLL